MNSAYDASAAPLIQSLGWPANCNLIQKETATRMYKSLNELAPEYVRNLFTRCSDSNGRVFRLTDTDLKLPLLKTSAGQKFFSYRGARLRLITISPKNRYPKRDYFTKPRPLILLEASGSLSIAITKAI